MYFQTTVFLTFVVVEVATRPSPCDGTKDLVGISDNVANRGNPLSINTDTHETFYKYSYSSVLVMLLRKR
jgi:hypothetical protein